MSYWSDMGGAVNMKDPTKAANFAMWYQRTGGHEGEKWHKKLTEDLNSFTNPGLPYPHNE